MEIKQTQSALSLCVCVRVCVFMLYLQLSNCMIQV